MIIIRDFEKNLLNKMSHKIAVKLPKNVAPKNHYHKLLQTTCTITKKSHKVTGNPRVTQALYVIAKLPRLSLTHDRLFKKLEAPLTLQGLASFFYFFLKVGKN